MPRSHAVVILGGHRCATSAVAGIVHYLGIPAALTDSSKDLLQGRADNPAGHFEDRTFLRLHQRMIGGDNWRHPDVTKFNLSPAIRREYAQHVRRRCDHSHKWSVKDPRLCYLFPVLIEALAVHGATVSVIALRRNTQDVGKSLARRNHLSLQSAIKIATRYEAALAAQQVLCLTQAIPLLDLTAERLRAAPEGTTQAIAAHCGVQTTPTPLYSAQNPHSAQPG